MYEQPKTVPVHRRSPAHPHAHLTGATTRKAADPRIERLVGHLDALRTATEAVRRAADDPTERSELDTALAQLTARVATISAGSAGAVRPRVTGPAGVSTPRKSRYELHDHAHALAGRLLLVAAAQQDTVTAVLACRRMDSHAAALRQPG